MIFYFKTWILHLLIKSLFYFIPRHTKLQTKKLRRSSSECREEGWNLKRGLGRAVERITSEVSVDAMIERELFA